FGPRSDAARVHKVGYDDDRAVPAAASDDLRAEPRPDRRDPLRRPVDPRLEPLEGGEKQRAADEAEVPKDVRPQLLDVVHEASTANAPSEHPHEGQRERRGDDDRHVPVSSVKGDRKEHEEVQDGEVKDTSQWTG